MSYPTPAKTTFETLEVKKSKFIAYVCAASTREQAFDQLEQVKTLYPDARHHCWAYLLGDPESPNSAAMSDDGEPSGTAGKPILNVLQHKGVGDIMLIVVRYFGGIKLGAGGLVRAYSNAAQAAMEKIVTEHHVELLPMHLLVDFKHEQFVRHLTSEYQGQIMSVDYAQKVNMLISLPESNIQDFTASCHNIGIQIKQG
ncbi:YigZ family protein [Aliiglaciecola lipolytica]|uniref:IMPACT family member in pol 5'region n=1 Tax=Aliiglaciecola lipolytica E3 TaxID=1127673 RepID=K6Y6P2_9ALTE|nr:YigZ family protein [Aliiglaciecola lipolytica]GAC13882.1 IMPACT family member in pol 5'region [Aliiglaciecola lipolytica E3]